MSTIPKRKIYVVGAATHYINWMEGELVDKMTDADLIVFTGGEDVSPYLYGKKPHYSAFHNRERDKREVAEYHLARAIGKPIIGICRGAQLLCVMAGGILVQDQNNPRFIHTLKTFDDKIIYTTSTHHQAQYPWGLAADEYKLLAWAGVHQSTYHYGENDKQELVFNKAPGEKEVEIVLYPKIKALCIQGHPEMMYGFSFKYKDAADAIAYYRDLLNKHIAGTL